MFPCSYCEDPVTWEQRGICCDSCDIWFHKYCVDMGSFTFLVYSTTNVLWICCRCNHPILIEKYSICLKLKPQIILTIQILVALRTESIHRIQISLPHNTVVQFPPPFRPKNLQRNWSTLLINCRRIKERGGGPRVVVSIAAFKARVRG